MPLLKWIDKLLFPNRCLACRRLQKGDDVLCDSCRRTLGHRNDPTISFAGQPFAVCIAPFGYNATGRKLLHAYKFHGHFMAAPWLADRIVDTLSPYTEQSIDCVTWVPLHVGRYRERGYSQSHLLAKGIAQRLELPLVRALVKQSPTARQSSVKGVRARRANVKGAFSARSALVKDKTVLLVDDVWTTGATMNECCWTLHAAGVKAVYCATALSVDAK